MRAPRLFFILILLSSTPLLTPTAEAFEVEDVAFIAGHWQGELFGGSAEEIWMSPVGGTMLGSFRLVWPEVGRKLYELLVIENDDDGVVRLRFRHFDAALGLWEREIEKPNVFDLVEVDENRAVFTTSDPDQETLRMTFERDAAGGRLVVRVESRGDGDAPGETFEAVYLRRE